MGGQGRNALAAMMESAGTSIQSPTIPPNSSDAVAHRTPEDGGSGLPRFPEDLFAPHLNT
jgi:hypothetical protein